MIGSGCPSLVLLGAATLSSAAACLTGLGLGRWRSPQADLAHGAATHLIFKFTHTGTGRHELAELVIRYGKPLVLDMKEVDLFDQLPDLFDQIRPGLWKVTALVSPVLSHMRAELVSRLREFVRRHCTGHEANCCCLCSMCNVHWHGMTTQLPSE